MNLAIGFCVAATALASSAFAVEPALPAHVDLRPEFDRYSLVPKNQGDRDVCSLCAITGLAEFEWSRSNRPERFSEEFLIWAACETTGKQDEPAMFYEAIHGLCAAGICKEALMPFKSAADHRPPASEAIADAQGRNRWNALWIKGWDLKTGLSSNELTEVRRQLAEGHPVAMGARWPRPERTTNDATLVTPPAAEVFDGHSVLFVGYQDDPSQPGGGRLLFRNHRGPGWADHGYGWMTYHYASLYVNDAVALRWHRSAEAPVRIEAENLKVVSSSKTHAAPQEMSPWGAKLWSCGTQLYCNSQADGCLEAEFTASQSNQFRLELEATFAPDYGKLQVSVDGKETGASFDFYSARVHPSGPLDLGAVVLAEGKHRIGFKVVGKNELSAGYSFGLDTILLTPETAKPPQ